MMDWTAYPNFTEDEMRCKHTGRCHMDPLFMRRLQQLRDVFGKPMIVSSGYRDPSHPVERNKSSPGEHTTGHAADIAIAGADALRLVQIALGVGFNRIGVQQKGMGRYIHLGDSPVFPPGIWSY